MMVEEFLEILEKIALGQQFEVYTNDAIMTIVENLHIHGRHLEVESKDLMDRVFAFLHDASLDERLSITTRYQIKELIEWREVFVKQVNNSEQLARDKNLSAMFSTLSTQDGRCDPIVADFAVNKPNGYHGAKGGLAGENMNYAEQVMNDDTLRRNEVPVRHNAPSTVGGSCWLLASSNLGDSVLQSHNPAASGNVLPHEHPQTVVLGSSGVFGTNTNKNPITTEEILEEPKNITYNASELLFLASDPQSKNFPENLKNPSIIRDECQ